MSSTNVLNAQVMVWTMATRPLPRESLAYNLRFLMRFADKMSEAALEKKSGVSQKAINKILNGQSAANLDTVHKLAEAFGLTGWHLIMPSLPKDLISGSSIEKLYDAYIGIDEEGRGFIDEIIKRELTRRKK